MTESRNSDPSRPFWRTGDLARLWRDVSAIWSWVGSYSEQIKIFSGIFVALFVLYQYNDQLHQRKINRALEYLSQHYSAHHIKARTNSRLFWQEKENIVENIHDIGKWFTEQDAAILAKNNNEQLNAELKALLRDATNDVDLSNDAPQHQRYLNMIAEDVTLQEHIHALQNFYYSVAKCMDSGLCEEEVLCLIRPDVEGFEFLYRPYFIYWKMFYLESKIGEIDSFIQRCEKYYQHHTGA